MLLRLEERTAVLPVGSAEKGFLLLLALELLVVKPASPALVGRHLVFNHVGQNVSRRPVVPAPDRGSVITDICAAFPGSGGRLGKDDCGPFTVENLLLSLELLTTLGAGALIDAPVSSFVFGPEKHRRESRTVPPFHERSDPAEVAAPRGRMR